jgi:hypothetical protein
MQLFCHTCQAAFAGTSHCPKCGGRLLAPQESFIYSGPAKDNLPSEPVSPSLGNRVAIGAGVGLGLYFSLREVATAIGAITPDTPVLADGGAVDLALRLFSVLAGAMLAGAGRDRGLPAGAAAGAAAAGVLALVDVCIAGGLATAGLVPLIVAVILAVLAGPAGAVGAFIWPAAPILPDVLPMRASSRGSSLLTLAQEESELKAPRPTIWLRVLAGGMIAAVGLLASDEIRFALARGSMGLLQTGGANQGPMVGFQIAVFLIGLGGVIAGAATGAGIRHGMLAGLVAAIGVIAAAANRSDTPYPAIDGYFITMGRQPVPVTHVEGGVEIVGFVVAVCTAGGWLGGQLFLPLAPPYMRKRRLVRYM